MGKMKLSSLIIPAFLILSIAYAHSAEYTGPIYRQGVNGIAIMSDYAVCATDEGLEIIDISDPSAMKSIYKYATPRGAAAVAVDNNFAYLAAWDSGLYIFNISNPRKPLLAANFNVSSYASDIAIAGHYAYVAYGYSGLQIIDIADPSRPKQIGSFTNSGFAFKVIVDGKYAFVHDLNSGILIIDIENPAKPVLTNTYDISAGINDFAIADAQLYIAQRHDGLLAVDYSDINDLRQVGSMAYSNIDNLSIHGDYIIFAGGEANSEIGIARIKPANEMKLLSKVITQTWNKRIAIDGNTAFIAGCSGITAVNVATPSEAAIEGSYDVRPVIKHQYGIDPYISMPGEGRSSITDYNQDGRDFVLRNQDVYVAGRAGEEDAWQAFFMKADTSGTEAWSYDYGPWTIYDAAFALTGTSDNDFVLAGKVQPEPGRTNDDILLHKVNADGDSIWHHQYDLAGSSYDGNGFDRLWDIVELDNGDLIGCGTITARNFPIDPLVLPESHKDAGLLRFNSLGDISWVQNYGTTTSTETARTCIITSDNNLAFAGYSDYHYDNKNYLYVVKTDMDGEVIWERSLGDHDKWHIANWMQQAGDGNYVIAGEMETIRGIDGLVLKVSSDDGDIIWQRSFGDMYTDSFIDGIITESGDILLAGYKTVDTLDTRIPWLVRLDANGNYICEIEGNAADTSRYYFGLNGPIGEKYILGGDLLNPYDVFITNSDLSGCETLLSSYLPGDANMGVGQWPPQVIGGDVTYLVGYFRGINQACQIGNPGFYCSADANGDCQVIGSDVTKMVTYFRGLAQLSYCPDYPPAWLTPSDCPEEMPSGWPGCE